jgi:hypothetical protein
MIVEPRVGPSGMCFPCSRVKSTGTGVPTIGGERVAPSTSAVPKILTPGRISSLPVARGLRQSISFSKSYLTLGLRGRIPVRRIEKLGRGRKEVQ